ncbi:tubulin-specific chaperone D [Podospora australis]|uniref:Tubulin-specific chaperone D n=1 Tax=Podospora australis TaxID=1536484 RepID=A0AAN7AJB5_9PEZI|nr:tubulin-specific chaperone D [Podospora australis]
MDAPEEDLDIKLQKISGDLINEFDASLIPFLRIINSKTQTSSGNATTTVRSRVRSRDSNRLASLLDPFQELPQLLDPHLAKWISALGEAYLDYLLLPTSSRNKKFQSTARITEGLLMPLPQAIAKLIYTLCKIRGEKVVVRFLSNEVRWLELLLSALEGAEGASTTSTAIKWTWEERYIVLLWLSHLMLAPFDLATISSRNSAQEESVDDDDATTKQKKDVTQGLEWLTNTPNIPGITVRILPLAIKYLASPGKERDAAKALLVRIAMRKDMQELGVLDSLVSWALDALRPEPPSETKERTPYHYIGVLSFLAGILRSSADTSDMDRYLTKTFYAVHSAATSPNPETGAMGSALARKTMIKVIRSITVLVLRNQNNMEDMELVETTIGFLLESLSDNDTPVRFAASKALSIITLKLDSDMASQVVEAVLVSLNRNVLHGEGKKDRSAVDPVEWHGLMLTLSHLLYRRSPPAEQLADIVSALVMGLSFERRSLSGGSSGTNVRDAACFGIWALARRYTTAELVAVPTAALTTGVHKPGSSVLQITATELVAAACLDTAGNIRRGSSAALQELIGRHPDCVTKGIWVVQTVDYHAVALRSRALQEVALGVTKLSSVYGEAILEALLGWRGIGDVEAASRRAAGASYGTITAELAGTEAEPVKRLTQSVALILERIRGLQMRQVEERHGLLVSFAAVLDGLPGVLEGQQADYSNDILRQLVKLSIDALLEILEDCKTRTYRKPELIAEATSRLIISSAPILQAATSILSDGPDNSPSTLIPGPSLITENAGEITQLVLALGPKPAPLKRFVALARSNLQNWLTRQEPELITTASQAALVMLIFSDTAEREEIIREWASIVRTRPTSARAAATVGGGHFAALAMSYSILSTLDLAQEDRMLICDAITERWRTDDNMETRVAILQSLTKSDLLKHNTEVFMGLVAEGLDDYTTTARGDVGSHVRLQAIRATKALWEGAGFDAQDSTRLVQGLFLRILRLAAEKLDRVRVEAQAALALVLRDEPAASLLRLTFSSKPYFTFLLALLTSPGLLLPSISAPLTSSPESWMDSLLAGYVSSADTGNEDLVIATRAALCEFCETSPENTDAICSALARNLKTYQGVDRVLVPTLEIVGFLFRVGIFQEAGARKVVGYKGLCLQVQKAAYKSGNVRKIEACVRVYGGILSSASSTGQQGKEDGQGEVDEGEGIREAKTRLSALMFHPWPRVKSCVVDELWGLYQDERLKGVDWGRAGKGDIQRVVEGVGLV